jgi:hypothetical protein
MRLHGLALVHYQLENNGCWQVKPGVGISLIATESTEGHEKVIKKGLFLSVFFRGFCGHNIPHYQIETVLAGTRLSSIQERSTTGTAGT